MPLTETFNQDANSNITINGTGVAGTPTGGILSIQGETGMTPVTVTQSSASIGTLTTVASSATSVSLLATNANRKGFLLYNNSTKIAYVAFTATAASTAFTIQMPPQSVFESQSLYTRVISGIWAAANGNMQVTELT